MAAKYGISTDEFSFQIWIIIQKANYLKIIGFLDDDPSLEGKLIYGYPILGGHWVLSKTHRSHKIDTIYLCDEEIRCENLKRLRKIALQNNISIKKLNITIQEIENTDVEEESIRIKSEDSVSSL